MRIALATYFLILICGCRDSGGECRDASCDATVLSLTLEAPAARTCTVAIVAPEEALWTDAASVRASRIQRGPKAAISVVEKSGDPLPAILGTLTIAQSAQAELAVLETRCYAASGTELPDASATFREESR